MGHAVYTVSDPREIILKERARHLAYEKGYEEEYNMLCSIERLAPGIFAEEKGSQKPVCANVDLFSGLILPYAGHLRGYLYAVVCYCPCTGLVRPPGGGGILRQPGRSARPTSTWVSARSINH